MLGKLIKHEWKSTYKVCGLIFICVALFTLLSCISLRMPSIYSAMTYRDGGAFGVLDAMGALTFVLYVLTLLGASYGVIIYLGVHFHKSMYTDEGYLTHTLPVTVHQLFVSKILVGAVWMLLVGAAIIVSVVGLLYTFMCMYMPGTPAEVTGVLAESFSQLFEELGSDIQAELVHLTVSTVLTVVVGPFCSAAILFGSITLGQLFTRYRALMAIVCYIVVNILQSVLSFLIQIPLTIGYVMAGSDPVAYYAKTFDWSLVLSLITGVLLYFASYMVLTRKFDIE